jgi:hypothetical protein
MKLLDRIITRITRRPPDVVIGGAERPYLRRWWVMPRNPVCNVYLHEFVRSDDDRAHHTHPWLYNFSVLLRGEYVEHVIERGGLLRRFARRAGAVKFRLGASPHRLELINDQPCWTLFITGPRLREWGFLCGDRFVHWKAFTTPDGTGIGKGCAE